MSGGADVRDIGALSRLREGITKFSNQAQSALTAVQGDIQKTQALINEKERYWRQEVEKARREVEEAQKALDRCRQAQRNAKNKRSGGSMGCSAQEMALAAARARLQAAQAKLNQVLAWKSKVSQAVGQYTQQANRLRTLATTQGERAAQKLARSINKIQKYLKMPSLSVSSQSVLANATVMIPTIVGFFNSQKWKTDIVEAKGLELAKREFRKAGYHTRKGHYDKRHGPDFLAVKGNKYYKVELKTSSTRVLGPGAFEKQTQPEYVQRQDARGKKYHPTISSSNKSEKFGVMGVTVGLNLDSNGHPTINIYSVNQKGVPKLILTNIK